MIIRAHNINNVNMKHINDNYATTTVKMRYKESMQFDE